MPNLSGLAQRGAKLASAAKRKVNVHYLKRAAKSTEGQAAIEAAKKTQRMSGLHKSVSAGRGIKKVGRVSTRRDLKGTLEAKSLAYKKRDAAIAGGAVAAVGGGAALASRRRKK